MVLVNEAGLFFQNWDRFFVDSACKFSGFFGWRVKGTRRWRDGGNILVGSKKGATALSGLGQHNGRGIMGRCLADSPSLMLEATSNRELAQSSKSCSEVLEGNFLNTEMSTSPSTRDMEDRIRVVRVLVQHLDCFEGRQNQ